jgi:hypothetical protein
MGNKKSGTGAEEEAVCRSVCVICLYFNASDSAYSLLYTDILQCSVVCLQPHARLGLSPNRFRTYLVCYIVSFSQKCIDGTQCILFAWTHHWQYNILNICHGLLHFYNGIEEEPHYFANSEYKGTIYKLFLYGQISNEHLNEALRRFHSREMLDCFKMFETSCHIASAVNCPCK